MERGVAGFQALFNQGVDGFRGISTGITKSEGRAISGVAIGAAKHRDQLGNSAILVGAQCHGGLLAHDGRPTGEVFEQGRRVGGIDRLQEFLAANVDRAFQLFTHDGLGHVSSLAGDIEFPKGHGSVDQADARGAPTVILGVVAAAVGGGLIEAGAVVADFGLMDRSHLVEHGFGGLLTAAGRAGDAPDVGPEMAGVAEFTEPLVCGGQRAFGKVAGRFRFAEQVEEYGGMAVLAVVIMGHPWLVVAVGDGTLVGIEPEVVGGLADGGFDFLAAYTAFLGQDQARGEGNAGLVHRTVGGWGTVNSAVVFPRVGETMAPSADATAPHGDQLRHGLDGGQHFAVTRRQMIFGQEQVEVAQIPGLAGE